MPRLRLVPSIATLVVLAGACSGDAGYTFEPARAELLRETVDVVIRPSFRDVASSAARLRLAATRLCDGTPDAASVVATRDAWRALFLAWERTSAMQFGPTRDLNLGPELAFWPTRVDTIEANVLAPDPVTDAWIDALGAGGLGIFALEYLLYAPSDAAELTSALAASPRRCEYVVALTGHAERTAGAIVLEWDGAYGEAFATAASAGNTVFPSQLRAISTLVTQLVAAVTTLKATRLGNPLGDATAGVAQPTEVRARYSGLSNEGMLAELDGVRATWTAGVEGRGLGAYVSLRSPVVGETVLAQLTSSRAALEAIPGPLEDYVLRVEHPLAIEAQLEMRTLERTLAADVAMSLSISVMFTDADGD